MKQSMVISDVETPSSGTVLTPIGKPFEAATLHAPVSLLEDLTSESKSAPRIGHNGSDEFQQIVKAALRG